MNAGKPGEEISSLSSARDAPKYWLATTTFFIVTSLFILPLLCTEDVGAAESTDKSWLTLMRNATVAIGQKRKASVAQKNGSSLDEKEIFAIVGTGAILAMPDDQAKVPWLVTAKHVFSDPQTGFEPDSLQLRFAWFDQKPVDEYLGISLQLKKDGKPLWSAHPNQDIDLAAIPLKILKKEIGREGFDPIPLDNFATAEDIFEGATIIVLGYPGAVGPSFWTRAVVRSGVIAWTNPEQPEKQFLIDAMVFPGNSGGPVFKVPTGLDRGGNLIFGGGKISFLGLVSQGRKQESPLKAGGKQIELQGPSGAAKVMSEEWIGIGVVEPASRILELLKAAKEIREKSGLPQS